MFLASLPGRVFPAAAVVALALAPALRAADPPPPGDLESATAAKTNELRRAQHLRELRRDPKLDKAAHAYAEYLARSGQFSHEADGRKPWDRTDAAGYERAYVSENIVWSTAEDNPHTDALASRFLKSWAESPGHRRNMLDPDVDDLGVGAARAADGKYYAVQLFGIPASKAFEVRVVNKAGQAIAYRMGDQPATLQPNYTMTHKLVRPTEFALAQPGAGAEPVRREVKAAAQITVRKEGDRFVAE
jgi:uncharacterized protein YkwD